MKKARVYAHDLYDQHITSKGFNPFILAAETAFKDAIECARNEILHMLSPELAADIRDTLDKP